MGFGLSGAMQVCKNDNYFLLTSLCCEGWNGIIFPFTLNMRKKNWFYNC